MKPRLLELLACPGCGGALTVEHPRTEDDEIREGELVCGVCHQRHPIRRFIPRFVKTDLYVDTFSFEWDVFHDVQIDVRNRTNASEETFTAKTGFTPDQARDRLFLDAGVGAGRYAEVVSRWGGEVVGMDLSFAVDAAFRNIGKRENVHLVQADIYRPPFRKGVFDHVYSIGVLHHTPDTQKAFGSIAPLVKAGGSLAVYLYPRGPYHAFSDIWRKVSIRLPLRLMWFMSVAAVPLYYLYRVPLLGRLLRTLLPISMDPRWRWRWLDTFDWYTPRYQGKHTYPEVYRWYADNGFGDVELFEHPICMRGFKKAGCASPPAGFETAAGGIKSG